MPKTLYVSLMGITRQKSTIVTWKEKQNRIKGYHYGKAPVYKGRQQERKKTKTEVQKHQENNKMVLISPYMSIIA